MQMKSKALYMLVTQDKYELPLIVADSVGELALKTGQKRNVISSAMSHAKKKGFKSMYVKVIVD
jgi:hypothetical protein